MTFPSRAALFFIPALAVAACGGGSSSTSTSTGTGGGGQGGGGQGGAPAGELPCEVRMVFEGHCQQCHDATPVFGAPMPLVTYANLVAPAKSDPTKKVYELVEVRTHDDAKPMPQPPNPRLDAATQKTLDDWINAGAQPVADGSCSP